MALTEYTATVTVYDGNTPQQNVSVIWTIDMPRSHLDVATERFECYDAGYYNRTILTNANGASVLTVANSCTGKVTCQEVGLVDHPWMINGASIDIIDPGQDAF